MPYLNKFLSPQFSYIHQTDQTADSLDINSNNEDNLEVIIKKKKLMFWIHYFISLPC